MPVAVSIAWTWKLTAAPTAARLGARVDDRHLVGARPGEVSVERGLQAADHAGVGGDQAEFPVVFSEFAEKFSEPGTPWRSTCRSRR